MTDSNHFSFTRVKRSLGYFAIGKLGSGLVGLALLVLLARVLSRTDYGTYVTYVAIFEIVLLVSNFGLFPIAQRFVTDCRIKGTQRQLVKLIFWICLGRLVTLMVACGGLYLFSGMLLGFMGIQEVIASFLVYLLVMITEGVSRYLDMIFESLLLQGYAQASIFIRNTSKLIAFASVAWFGGGLTLDSLVRLEAMTTTGGMAIAVLLIIIYFWTHRAPKHDPVTPNRYAPSDMFRFSLLLYFAQVISQIYGGDAIKLIVARILGIIETASFGFAYSISMILQRYLPTFLLLGMARPLFVAKFAKGSDFSEINRMANLMFKLNTFCLVPVIAFFVLYGSQFSSLVSGGKYPEAGGMLASLCILLIFQSLHIILGLVALVTKLANSTLMGTIAGVLGVLLGIYSVPHFGVYGLVFGLILSELLWCVVAWLIQAHYGYGLRLDWLAVFKLTFVCISVIAILNNAPLPTANAIDLMVAFIYVVLSYLILAYLIKPFRNYERSTINRFLPKPVFLW